MRAESRVGRVLWGALLSAALCASSGCGLTLTIFGVALGTKTSSDRENFPPGGSIQTPTGLVNDVVAFKYTLIDPEGDAARIDVRWSIDGGATWSATPATAATGLPDHDGITGLTASANGEPHTFLWNAFADLGTLGPAANYTTVRVRFDIKQFDDNGSTIQSQDFPIYNRYTASVAGGAGAEFLDAIVTPGGMARRPNGNLVVADLAGHKVMEIDGVTGVQTRIAGTGLQGFNGDNLPATEAQLDFPADVAIDSQGNVFVCDSGNAAIRMVDAATGFITTVVGLNGWGFSGDGGPAAGAVLAGPEAISIDLSDNLWIADTQNNRVRFVNRGTTTRSFTFLVTPSATTPIIRTVTVQPGQIQTLAGGIGSSAGTLSGENVDPGLAALVAPREVLPLQFRFGPVILDLGFAVSDWGNDRVRVVNTVPPTPGLPAPSTNMYGENIPNGQIRTVAGGGNGLGGGIGDNGPALQGVLRGPQRLDTLFIFGLWIADTGNNRVRLVVSSTPNGIIFTRAGSGGFGFSGDGRIPQLASLAAPIGVLVDSSFNEIIGDTFNGRVRMVNPQVWADVWAISTTDVISVGGTGSVTRGSPATGLFSTNVGDVQPMTDVSAVGSTNVVAVGGQGAIRRWNGTSWTAETSNTTSTLTGVHQLSGTVGFAVGENGTIVSYTAASGTWAVQGAGLTTTSLRSVHAVASNNVFAVGDYDGTAGQAGVYRFNGSSWSIDTTVPSQPAGTNLHAVHSDSSGNVFIVGDDGQSPSAPVVLRYNGSWTDLSATLATDAGTAGATTDDLRGVFVVTGSGVVAVGDNGFITTFDGSNFAFPTRPTNIDLGGVHGTGANDVYAIGANDTLLHYNGTQWNTLVPNSHVTYCGVNVPALTISSLTQPPTQGVIAVSNPQGVVVEASGDVIFSNTGTHEVLHLDIQTRAITAMAGTGGPGFAGDGGAASPGSALVPDNLHSVWGPADNELWAVGQRGTIVRWAGTAWTVFRAGAEGVSALHDVHGLATNDIWAVGNDGTILHWNGAAWSAQNSGTTEDLHGVFALDTLNVWAVGTRGTILHFNGSTWSRQAGGTVSSSGGPIRDFHAVFAVASNDVYAVGDGSFNPTQGPVWHYNGTTWTRDGTLPTSVYALGFRGVYGFGPNDVYVVGEGTTVLHFWDPDGAGAQPLTWYAEATSSPGPHVNDVFGRAGGPNPGADLFLCGEFGRFMGGLGSDNWCQGCGPNDTINTTVTFTGGIAFPSGAAVVVGNAGTVYRQASAGGAWTLQLGTGQLSSPRGLALWTPPVGGPILFIADEDNGRIRAVNLGSTAFTMYPSAAAPIVIPASGIATVAGGTFGLASPWGDGGFATAAELTNPYAVAVDPPSGDLYISDTARHLVRRVLATTGVINTVAGSVALGAGFSGDGGAATSAQIDTPTGLTIHRTDSTTAELYIADALNHRVRMVNLGTANTTIAGVTVAANDIDTLIGTGTAGFNTDGLPPLQTDLFIPAFPLRVGNTIYFTDSENHRVRSVPVTGATITVSTNAGTGQAGYGGDPKPALFALFNAPAGLAWDPVALSLYVADTDNSRVRRFRP